MPVLPDAASSPCPLPGHGARVKFLGWDVQTMSWPLFRWIHRVCEMEIIEVEMDASILLSIYCKGCKELYLNAPEAARKAVALARAREG